MSNSKESKNKKNENENANKNCEDNLGLASISYADYVILASTLAYSLFKEMKRDDLAMIITLMYLVISDLQVLIAQEGIIKANCGNNTPDEEDDLEFEEEIEIIPVSRNRRYKKNRKTNGKIKKKSKKNK